MPPNAGRRSHGLSRSGRTLLAAIAVLSCHPKDGQLFAPLVGSNIDYPDITPPSIRSYIDLPSLPINDNRFAVLVREVPGPTGQRVSGLHLPSLKATAANGSILAVAPSSKTDVFEVDVTGRPNGAEMLRIEAADVAGNASAGVFSFILGRAPPTVTHNIPATFSSMQPNATLNVSGQISTPHSLTVSTMYVRQPLANGECASTAPLFGQGTTAGTVNQNTFSIPAAGQFTFPVMLNGPSTVQGPQTMGVCFQFAAAYNAVNRFNEPNPVTMDQLYRLTFTWDVMPPSTGMISGRVTVNTTSPLPGVTVSIPSRSTTTDANGNYSFADVPEGNTPVTLTNIPTEVLCPTVSKSGSVTAGQTVQLDFNCLRFSVNADGLYRHIAAGVSEVCARISGLLGFSTRGEPIALENIAGASYTVQWSGPGTVGSTTRSGTLNAQSQAIDRQQINAFGTYTANVTVTYQGATRQVTASVSVGGSQGTCPAP
jgi:hypothetical protein